MALIDVQKVVKQFRKGPATITPLQETDLQVEKGEFVSLMGASGSGKTTLLNLIAGIDRCTSGRIVVNSTDITTLSRTRLATSATSSRRTISSRSSPRMRMSSCRCSCCR
jgi:putative ABC transport system ATP-binding protein